MTGGHITIGLTALALAAGVQGCASSGGPGVDGQEAQELFARYSGEWVLDVEASEDPVSKVQEVVAARFSGTGGFGAPDSDPWGAGDRGGGLASWGSGGPGAAKESPGPTLDPEAIGGVLQPPRRLDLVLTAGVLTVAANGGDRLVLPTDGTAVEETLGETVVATRARWKDGLLRTERRMDDGPTLRQVLEVSADGNRLLVIRSVEVDGGDRVDVQFAYDRAVTDQD